MIGSLRGTLLDRTGTDVTVEVGGMGYRMSTTPATSGALGVEGSEVFVWVHHHIREDAQTLYGFAGREERDVFETLIGTRRRPGAGSRDLVDALAAGTPPRHRDRRCVGALPGAGRRAQDGATPARRAEVAPRRVGRRRPPGARRRRCVAVGCHRSLGPRRRSRRPGRPRLRHEEIAGVVGQLPLDGDASDLLRQACEARRVRGLA